MNVKLFTKHTKEEHADALAAYLPNDRNYAAKGIDGTKLRQLLIGLSGQPKTAEEFIILVWNELDPTATTLFIDDWEKAVGIPDE